MTIELDDNKVWIDGCFDFTHHGHAGAILQARQTVNQKGELFCGVHSDEAITYNKGPPVMNNSERYEHTRSNRWCSYVIEDAPYVTEPDVLDKYGCKYVVHGDDITLDANGEDCYQIMKDMDRFKVVKRTYGVSTTDIIQRMLTGHILPKNDASYYPTHAELEFYSKGIDGFNPHCYVFENKLDTIKVKGGYALDFENTVVISGEFDLFHMGHIEQLSNARKLYPNKKIVVGLTSNINSRSIMTIKERSLSILSCKYVDGLIIEPDIKEIIDNVHKIIEIDSPELNLKEDKFKYLTKETIMNRIESERELYVDRNKKKGMA